jgi:hypothetical protein
MIRSAENDVVYVNLENFLYFLDIIDKLTLGLGPEKDLTPYDVDIIE